MCVGIFAMSLVRGDIHLVLVSCSAILSELKLHGESRYREWKLSPHIAKYVHSRYEMTVLARFYVLYYF